MSISSPPFNATITNQNDFTPINDMVPVTYSDVTPLQYQGQAIPCRAILVQGAGNLAIVTPMGNTVTLTVSANWFGVQYIRCAYIKATGTTVGAGLVHACY